MNDYNDRQLIANWPANNKVKIKRSWDAYSKIYSGDISSHSKGNKVPKNKGKWGGGFLSGRAIGDEWDTPIKSIKVPVGLWGTVYNDVNCNIDKPSNDHGLLNVYWGIDPNGAPKVDPKNKYGGSDNDGRTEYSKEQGDKIPRRIPDDISTDCATGKKFTNKKGKFEDDKCFVGIAAKGEGGNCVRSGIHLGSYCQLGENLSTEECKPCNIVDTSDDDHYCNWSKNRLCNKGMDDKCEGDEHCSQWWVKNSICNTYCGESNSPEFKCVDGWGKYCSTNFKDDKDLCKMVWTELDKKGPFSRSQEYIEKACNVADKSNDIFSGICKDLCVFDGDGKGGVNNNWCKTQKQNYCDRDYNIFSPECQSFCKKVSGAENESFCKNKLFDNFCKEIIENNKGDSKKINELMGMPVKDYLMKVKGIDISELTTVSSDLKVGNFCGCALGDSFYKDDVDLKVNRWTNKGLNNNLSEQIKSSIITKPKCFYEWCKGDNSPQPPDIKTQVCPDCVQNIITDLSNSKIIDSTIVSKATSECTGLRPIPVKPSDKPVIPDKPDKPSDKPSAKPYKPDIPSHYGKQKMLFTFLFLFLILTGFHLVYNRD
jgi:hypothetical protein